MYILGICNDETASACLMKNGVVLAAVSEERFTRVKMDNSFPSRSIQYCLDFEGITLKEVHVISYAWSKGFSADLLKPYIDRAIDFHNDEKALEIFNDRIKLEITQDSQKRSEFDNWVTENIDVRNTQVRNYYHHEAHAASAAFFSPFDTGVVFTADGRGDFESTVIWRFNRFFDRPLTKLYSALSTDSFGYYYGRITGLLGFKPIRHEGKITGLAAYGDPSKAMELCKKMINVSDGRVIGQLGKFYRPFFQPYEHELTGEVKNFLREDIASSAQVHLENMMCELLNHYLTEFPDDQVNLMCAGGVFGNVKVTQALKKIKKIKSTYVQPQMGDGGLCLGAAALANEQCLKYKGNPSQKTKPMQSMYLGPNPSYNNQMQVLPKPFDVCDSKLAPEKMVGSLLLGRVIGLVQKRMEFGPRALCNRSIIYRTSDPSINDWLNKRMRRTEFMPFAPVIRLERAEEIILNYKKDDVTLNFMTSTVEVSKKFKELCPAVVHIDNTARPQIVTAQSNPFIWNVLRLWETSSGELSLVNTSFNAHEEPIIQSESDGIAALNDGIVDELWISKGEEFVVYK